MSDDGVVEIDDSEMERRIEAVKTYFRGLSTTQAEALLMGVANNVEQDVYYPF